MLRTWRGTLVSMAAWPLETRGAAGPALTHRSPRPMPGAPLRRVWLPMSLNFNDPEDDEDRREVIQLDSLARRRQVAATRWGFILVTMMRTVAALWFLLGIIYWLRIIMPGEAPLDALPVDVAVVIVFFAVANLAAAIGLWLAAPWGGVLWLIAAVAELAASWFMPAYIRGGPTIWLLYSALILAYLVFTWLAAREREQF